MKKIILFTGIISLFVLSSCSEDNENNINSTAYLFNSDSSMLAVNAGGESFIEVEIGVTTKSGIDRPIEMLIDPSSTANPSEYSIDTSSLVIPAGEYNTKVKISGNFDNVPESGTSTLVLKINTDEQVISGKDIHTVNIFRHCVSDLSGLYSVTTTYSTHDFLPDFSTYTMNVQIHVTSTENSYYVDDFSGGLYSIGPYASAYGTGTISNRMDFKVVCDKVSWTGQSDPWGAIIPVVDGMNNYNFETGVITISWHCVAYGESGTSVYTPL